MSFLQSTLSTLTDNIRKLEAELAKDGSPPLHLWEPTHYDKLDDVERYIRPETFSQIEKIRIDVAAIDAAVTPTRLKHLSLGLSSLKPTVLEVAVNLGISDAIEELGGEVPLSKLAKHLDVNENKLGRIIRLLATEFIYKETAPDVFANNRHSMTLLKKQGSEAFLSLIGQYCTISSTGLLKNITDPDTKHSFDENKAPFCSTVSKNGETFLQYLMLPENADALDKSARGVVPWLNRITRQPLICGYPWGDLGSATVIDIGCGPGDNGIDLLRHFPQLHWEFQDLPPVLEGLKSSFPSDFRGRIDNGDIRFVVQDYLTPNKSEGEVWYLRGVIREHDDETSVKILKHVAEGMRKTPGSIMLINEVLVSSASLVPSSEAPASVVASEHIPAHQSAMPDIADLMTWNTFCFFGGYERSFLETEALLVRAGLRMNRVFKLSTFTATLEAVPAG